MVNLTNFSLLIEFSYVRPHFESMGHGCTLLIDKHCIDPSVVRTGKAIRKHIRLPYAMHME